MFRIRREVEFIHCLTRAQKAHLFSLHYFVSELNIALNGRFSSAVLSRVQWRFTNKNIIDTTLEVVFLLQFTVFSILIEITTEKYISGLIFWNDFTYKFSIKYSINFYALQPLCNEESFKSGTWNNFCNNELNEAVGPFNEFYGKLATAKLRAKIRKLEETMTDEERREEQLIQQKQLESICEMIMHEPEKFGLHDKSEVTEQMKLYSV
ncbi:unnamed protein product [Wuchereria bancrofti]|uniref:Matrix-remodeling-associated protein 7 helical domain-containing protein n=1 Tax=Wuchereria bancrofti TaxID=6293 RepID=A0A3P7EFV4_WUCBA|nr:unnamed protein product [Wuchereria bancrofti]